MSPAKTLPPAEADVGRAAPDGCGVVFWSVFWILGGSCVVYAVCVALFAPTLGPASALQTAAGQGIAEMFLVSLAIVALMFLWSLRQLLPF